MSTGPEPRAPAPLPSPGSAGAPSSFPSWARPAMWTSIVLILMTGAVLIFKSCRDMPVEMAGKAVDMVGKTGEAVQRAGQVLENIAAAFKRGTISTAFFSYATRLHGTQYFQFATLKQTEVFTRSDETSTVFGYVPLPEVVVEARAPVEFTYYLDLQAPWHFVVHEQVVYVLAPRIQFNKPAVDVSAITFEVRRGSVFRNSTEVRESLRKTITQLSQIRARENVALVRETGRKQVVEFVENWLARAFTDGQKYPAKVLFPDEALPAGVEKPEVPGLPR